MHFVDLGEGDYLNLATVVRVEFTTDGTVAVVTTVAPDYDTVSDEEHPVVVPYRLTIAGDRARTLRTALRLLRGELDALT